MRLVFPFRLFCNFPAQKVFLCRQFSFPPCFPTDLDRPAFLPKMIGTNQEPVSISFLFQSKRHAGFLLLRSPCCPAKTNVWAALFQRSILQEDNKPFSIVRTISQRLSIRFCRRHFSLCRHSSRAFPIFPKKQAKGNPSARFYCVLLIRRIHPSYR